MELINFGLTAFGTFLGAGVALLSERLTRAREATLREEAAINNLIMDLAAKRALVVKLDSDWAHGEIERVVDSVHNARGLIRETRRQLRPRSYALSPLRRMAMACNFFLESAEHESPEAARAALVHMAQELTAAVGELHAARPRRVLKDAPGSASSRGAS